MKNFQLWLFSAAMGFLFIFFVNVSPLSRLGLGLELPVGWSSDNVQPGTACTLMRIPSEGIPLAHERQGTACTTDYNRFASIMNGLAGIGIGVLYSAVAHKQWDKHRDKKPQI